MTQIVAPIAPAHQLPPLDGMMTSASERLLSRCSKVGASYVCETCCALNRCRKELGCGVAMLLRLF